MKFEPTFTMLDVDREIDRIVEKSEEFILKKLFTIGEKCVNYARSNHAYLDDTGNLTSSIGYAVYRDGKRIGVSASEIRGLSVLMLEELQGINKNTKLINQTNVVLEKIKTNTDRI
ncbi:MAG: hypothetical protein QM305_09710 [Bacteroidota bacterium]|nr:hypothetical protein [Bacteroidota bacterium]